MAAADLLIVSSDHNEGWGAVVNEGMAAACTVVCSHGVGAAPYLIRSGENGVMYECAKLDSLYSAVVDCIGNPDAMRRMGAAAYVTVRERWSAAVAASRLLEFISHYISCGDTPFEEGILSKAQIIKNDWIK